MGIHKEFDAHLLEPYEFLRFGWETLIRSYQFRTQGYLHIQYRRHSLHPLYHKDFERCNTPSHKLSTYLGYNLHSQSL